MKCPKCNGKLYVSATLAYHDNTIVRRRECKKCRKKYKSKEQITGEYEGYPR